MTTTLHSALLLGTTVPEPSKTDDRIYVCSAWWHDDLGLIRVYPLPMVSPPRRWHLYDIDVVRNPKDSRVESWKIQSAPDGTSPLRHIGKLPDSQRRNLADWVNAKHLPTSIAEANDRRLSLALVRPEGLEFDLEHNMDSPNSPQLRLFDPDSAPQLGAKRFPYIPRLRFHDGRQHHLMLRDWGAYEQMRKHVGKEREMPSWLHLGPRSMLLVGNLNHQRNAWVVISVLNIASPQLSLMEAIA